MSPMNQKFFTGFFTTWPARYANKVKANWLYVLPGVLFGVGVYQYGNMASTTSMCTTARERRAPNQPASARTVAD
eukprot:CAMPEP_0205829152 /NCGR_PEP_ID=MMETSP0206-20130828/37212_1 /ASSEMBLY_ACC=CAM_ASM_000279 /TAXON_ID=36767 /ORGANISM="Euplotes focardii, Strain TN1" /LENGTH=74 /DNA_ID=CAMNT_0053131605 /DNA_START=51 /DNA_END=273 /DNA_ORIENTATION=-